MDYVDKKHGDDTKDKVIYLTYDAGYENGNVEKILNLHPTTQSHQNLCFFIVKWVKIVSR